MSQLFKKYGARAVISADVIAQEAYQDRAIQTKLKKIFGFRTHLNRAAIAKEVFSDGRKRKLLEALIHPFVRKKIQKELAALQDRVAIVEVPLLFETGFEQFCDVTVAVTAPQPQIEKRLTKQGFLKSEIRARQSAQLSQTEKCRLADFVIRNSGSKEELREQVMRLMEKIVFQNSSLNKGVK